MSIAIWWCIFALISWKRTKDIFEYLSSAAAAAVQPNTNETKPNRGYMLYLWSQKV